MREWTPRRISADVELSGETVRERLTGTQSIPMLLTPHDVAHVLRTTRRAVYAMIERGQLPGIVRIRRRVLVRADELLNWLNQKSAPSLKE